MSHKAIQQCCKYVFTIHVLMDFRLSHHSSIVLAQPEHCESKWNSNNYTAEILLSFIFTPFYQKLTVATYCLSSFVLVKMALLYFLIFIFITNVRSQCCTLTSTTYACPKTCNRTDFIVTKEAIDWDTLIFPTQINIGLCQGKCDTRTVAQPTTIHRTLLDRAK